jgi:predicted nucleic acid-binding protein
LILVDTSAWVEFQHATGSRAHLRLRQAIEDDEPLATTGLVVLELLAGARDELHALRLRRLLHRCRFLELEEPFDYEAAAALYRSCRQQGTTIRRMPDCLIAAVAMRNRAAVLHQDRDFAAIARHGPLTLLD